MPVRKPQSLKRRTLIIALRVLLCIPLLYVIGVLWETRSCYDPGLGGALTVVAVGFLVFVVWRSPVGRASPRSVVVGIFFGLELLIILSVTTVVWFWYYVGVLDRAPVLAVVLSALGALIGLTIVRDLVAWYQRKEEKR